MSNKALPIVLVALAMVCFVGLAFAEDAKNGAIEGKVVKAGNGSLTMTDKDGKAEQTLKVAPNAQITLDGKACKLEDLKAGAHFRATQGTEADKALIRIDAMSK